MNVTQELTAQLRSILPGLPDNITKLEVILELGQPPKVNCQYIIKNMGNDVKESRAYFVGGEMPPPNSVSVIG